MRKRVIAWGALTFAGVAWVVLSVHLNLAATEQVEPTTAAEAPTSDSKTQPQPAKTEQFQLFRPRHNSSSPRVYKQRIKERRERMGSRRREAVISIRSQIEQTHRQKPSPQHRDDEWKRRRQQFIKHKSGMIEPKSIPQDHPYVCAKRYNGKCGLENCSEDNNNSKTMDFGFVLHQQNTRGTAMRVAGAARSGSGCALSHRHKFVYIHVLKSGGMTLKGFLKRALCQNSTKLPCRAGPEVLDIVNCRRAAEHHDYFVWSFIRNPFSRMYSAYAMADSMRFKPTSDNNKNISRMTFHEFVKQPRERHHHSVMSKSHYEPQMKFLFDADNCPVFDFLGRLERFDQDMRIILDQIGSPELKRYYERNTLYDESTSFGKRKKQQDHGGKLNNAFTDELLPYISREFAADFKLLGYSDKGLPNG